MPASKQRARFAVVAQEVRELAQRSAKAAKEIKELINNSGKQVKVGVSLVSNTGEALTVIVDEVKEIDRHISAIVEAAREQSTALQEINMAVNSMDQGTQQNAAMVEKRPPPAIRSFRKSAASRTCSASSISAARPPRGHVRNHPGMRAEGRLPFTSCVQN